MHYLTRASSPVTCRASKKSASTTTGADKTSGYQEAWFRSTRSTLDAQSTTEGRRRVLREYVEANRKANGGREREDLYTDNWDGDVYKGNPVNVLSVILAVSIIAPLVGLVFALQTYGTLWG